MQDGAELALAIAAHPDDIEAALTSYEEVLFPRSADAATAAVAVNEAMGQMLIDGLDHGERGERSA
jgi:2-polyprenyl-6-methoxyphenol hydroxylase-like FAD-dependent oxidoreductase